MITLNTALLGFTHIIDMMSSTWIPYYIYITVDDSSAKEMKNYCLWVVVDGKINNSARIYFLSQKHIQIPRGGLIFGLYQP